jgi:hypothetical protein
MSISERARDRLSATLRQAVLREVEPFRGKDLAVPLSGGVDSTSLLVAAMTVGANVRTYTFCLSGRLSTDASAARRTAKFFGVEHRLVHLPTSIDVLADETVELITKHGITGKAPVECLWGMTRLFREADERHFIVGIRADSYFGLSKSAALNHKHSPAGMHDYRMKAISKAGQPAMLANFAESIGKVATCPYHGAHDVLIPAFRNTTWEIINKPRQKEIIRRAFPEMDRLSLGLHTNLQLGDSGIQGHFKRLLRSRLNADGRFKTTVALYNAIARGEVQ